MGTDTVLESKTVIEDAKKLGVNATPTFFINGEKHIGVISIEQFRQILNARLALS